MLESSAPAHVRMLPATSHEKLIVSGIVRGDCQIADGCPFCTTEYGKSVCPRLSLAMRLLVHENCRGGKKSSLVSWAGPLARDKLIRDKEAKVC